MAPSMIDVGTFFADEMMAFGCKLETVLINSEGKLRFANAKK